MSTESSNAAFSVVPPAETPPPDAPAPSPAEAVTSSDDSERKDSVTVSYLLDDPMHRYQEPIIPTASESGMESIRAIIAPGKETCDARFAACAPDDTSYMNTTALKSSRDVILDAICYASAAESITAAEAESWHEDTHSAILVLGSVRPLHRVHQISLLHALHPFSKPATFDLSNIVSLATLAIDIRSLHASVLVK
jgi:hypothetical protein